MIEKKNFSTQLDIKKFSLSNIEIKIEIREKNSKWKNTMQIFQYMKYSTHKWYHSKRINDRK